MDYSKICICCMRERPARHGACPHCGFQPEKYTGRPYALPPMTILNGKYMVGIVLGAGGFGITYAALDMRLERRVAIKEFFMRGSMYRESSRSSTVTYTADDHDQEAVLRLSIGKFESEARILARLEDLPGIVRVYEIFNENNTIYIALEYLEGLTVKEYVRANGGRLPAEEVLAKMTPVMRSLSVLHRQNILHRDISPDNIMVLQQGGMTLFDFGGAKILDDRHSSMTMRKNGYSPVEQILNEDQGPWTDEYALAATMYYCITGKVPPDSIRRMRNTERLVPPSELGAAISSDAERVLLKALAVNSKDRYPDVEVFAGELIQAAFGRKKGKKVLTPAVLAGISGVCVLAGILLAFGLTKGGSDRTGSGSAAPAATVTPTAAVTATVTPTASAAPAVTATVTPTAAAAPAVTPTAAVTATVTPTAAAPVVTTPPATLLPESTTMSSNVLAPDGDIPRRTGFVSWADAGIADYEIQFTDPNAEAKARVLTGKDSGTIMLSDMWETEVLHFSPVDETHKIQDISFMSDLNNLEQVILNNNEISDLSPLAPLTNLEFCGFNTNRVSDLSPLEGIESLARIDMSSNPISDFSPLSEMTNLTVIHSYDCGLTDDNFSAYIDCIKDLPSLNKLDIGKNRIADFSPLSRMTQIGEFSMWDSELDDGMLENLVTALEKIPGLYKVSLKNNRITDPTPLTRLTNLRELVISNNPIADTSSLHDFTGVKLTAEDLY